MSKETNNLKTKKSALIGYLECELKESKSLEEFKAKFAEIKTINELSDQSSGEVTVAEKIDGAEFDSIVIGETARKTMQIMNEVEALNDFWLEVMERFVTREGSEESGRPLLDAEKQALVKLLTKNREKMSSQELYNSTRRKVGLSEETYNALTEAAEKTGVTPEKVLHDIICEHLSVET